MMFALSRAIAVAWAAEISPVAKALQVSGRCAVSVRATSIRYCAVLPDIRSAAPTSSRFASSTFEYLDSDLVGSLPATATIARCMRDCSQPDCFSRALRKSTRPLLVSSIGSIPTRADKTSMPAGECRSDATWEATESVMKSDSAVSAELC